jgi:hypothetical protein
MHIEVQDDIDELCDEIGHVAAISLRMPQLPPARYRC